jgi:glycosyltransferase involved in cell wall biosynthesis
MNGIVTYTHNMRQMLKDRGVKVCIIAKNLEADAPNADLDQVHLMRNVNQMKGSLIKRVFGWVERRVESWAEEGREQRIGREISRIVGLLQKEQGLQLLQMEETFGWSRSVIKTCEIPVIVRLHGPWFLNGSFDERSKNPASLRRIRREGEGIAAAAGITAPSQDVIDQVRKFYGLALPDAVSIPIPMVPPPEDQRWRLDACDRNRILFVGRFDLHKGGDLVIDAFRKVLDERPQARLSFAGADSGIPVEGQSLQKLQPYIEARLPGALADGRIEWLGVQTPEQLNAQRRRALVTVIASRYETFGNTLREAMITGCPVVSSDIGGLGEILDNGKNSLRFEAGDAGDLAQKLIWMLDNPERAASLGRQALEDCSQRYAPSRIAEETLAYYQKVLQRHRR